MLVGTWTVLDLRKLCRELFSGIFLWPADQYLAKDSKRTLCTSPGSFLCSRFFFLLSYFCPANLDFPKLRSHVFWNQWSSLWILCPCTAAWKLSLGGKLVYLGTHLLSGLEQSCVAFIQCLKTLVLWIFFFFLVF